jgi:hypothetical protein
MLVGKTARKEMRRKREGMAAMISTVRMMRSSGSRRMGLPEKPIEDGPCRQNPQENHQSIYPQGEGVLAGA